MKFPKIETSRTEIENEIENEIKLNYDPKL